MDILELDPEVLDKTASIIELYCNKQMGIMNEYLSNINSLSSEWTDDRTFGSLLDEVKKLKDSIVTLMEEIKSYYPQYFRNKAEEIRNRPKGI